MKVEFRFNSINTLTLTPENQKDKVLLQLFFEDKINLSVVSGESYTIKAEEKQNEIKRTD